jgi:hypothetical protein
MSAPQGRMLNAPAGSPASSADSASTSSTVSGDGLSTTAQPAASASGILNIARHCGTCDGAIAPTTPTGSRCTTICPPVSPVRTSFSSRLSTRSA